MGFLSGFAKGLEEGGKHQMSVKGSGLFQPAVSKLLPVPSTMMYGQPVSEIPQTPNMADPAKAQADLSGAIGGVTNFGQDMLQQKFPMAYRVAQALGKIESSGNYGAVGPTVKGKNAFGKYQVMEQNVPSWGQEATGKPVTLEQFKSDHALQDRIAVYKVNAYLDQGYSPQDVASIWLSGKPMTGNQRKDLATGISVPQYVDKFNKAFQL